VTKNLTLKLVSVIAATLLAFALQDASNASVVSLFVPIELRNPPTDKVLMKRMRQGVQITIKGPSFLIGEVAASPPPLRLKLPDDVGGKYTAQLMASDISLPPSVSVLTLDPPEVELAFENIDERDVRVEVPQLGLLAKDLVLVDIALDPPGVTVKGPQSEVRQLRAGATEPLDLREIKESETVTLRLRKPGPLSSMSVESVSARVTVEKRPVERQFVARPVELRGTGDAKWVKLSPTMVTVVLAGDPALLAEIEPEQVIPFVELKKQPPREGEFYDVSVDAPKGVKVVKTAPPSVTAWYHGPSKGGSTSQSKKR
jgi:hypothetical protein